MMAALNSPGQTIIKAKKSRDHTENIFKYLGIPIVVKNKDNDEIKVKGGKSLSRLIIRFLLTQVHVLSL